ncbi:MAG: alpha/beta fold hydrolase, partial [Candidatus Bathyarchaeia archaeon]
MPKALVNDVRLYYEVEGEGEPLALVGGGLFGRQNWGMVIDELKNNFRVLSYDQRGYGQSERPIQDYSINLWADDLAALLDVVGIRKTHVAGTSMGAMVALKFAAQYPVRTMSVVADCAFAKPDRRRKMLLETWRRLAHTVGVGEIFADHVFTQAVGDNFLDSARANQAIAMNRQIVSMNSIETVVQACLAMENLDLSRDLRKIKSPTLIMNAPGDLIT